jgi:hypothetical protein
MQHPLDNAHKTHDHTTNKFHLPKTSQGALPLLLTTRHRIVRLNILTPLRAAHAHFISECFAALYMIQHHDLVTQTTVFVELFVPRSTPVPELGIGDQGGGWELRLTSLEVIEWRCDDEVNMWQ